MKVVYCGLLIILYLSFCMGSYFTALHKSRFINLERLSQIEQSIYVIESIDNDVTENLKEVLLQTIELERFNIVDSQNKMKTFSVIEFLSYPWYSVMNSPPPLIDMKSMVINGVVINGVRLD